ncbi:MAG: hypothetical protein IPO58_09675 [Betaproteobacteria bacterium]|nr:hypothetical protein [Betaproteobacteria bacterium]
MSLAAGGLDLGCTDLIVAGTLQTNSAPVTNVRNLIIQPGGTIDAGTSVISVGGNWSNNGTFNAGTSQVAFSDICGVNPAVVSGNTAFYDVSFTSSSGKTWQFASGSTQTIAHFLSIQGTTPNPVQFASSVPGVVAYIQLLGGQSIAHVGVTDVWATGIWLAPYLTNEGGGGNANRWFGAPDYARIPTLSPVGLLALILLLAAVVGGTWSRRRRT